MLKECGIQYNNLTPHLNNALNYHSIAHKKNDSYTMMLIPKDDGNN
jgi:hypothetical protein